jgi:hypothetical protein
LGNIFGFEYNLPFSVEAWIYPSSITSSRVIISKGDGSSPAVNWNLQIYNTKLYMTLQNNVGGGKIVQVHVNDAISTNLWQHIVMVYNGNGKASGVKIYVNGTDKFIVTDYDTLNNASISNIRNCLIGALDGSTGKSGYFSGKIDEVVIYNKTLSASEISFRYNSGVGTELMGELINATSGYIRSKPITLNADRWNYFNSIYNNQQGNITFNILDNSNNILCSSLGDISSCAGIDSPIKIYANLSRQNQNNITPEIDKYWVNWYNITAEEIKGSGEMHIQDVSLTSLVLDDIALRVIQYFIALKDILLR